jgi:hypothetical protein
VIVYPITAADLTLLVPRLFSAAIKRAEEGFLGQPLVVANLQEDQDLILQNIPAIVADINAAATAAEPEETS